MLDRLGRHSAAYVIRRAYRISGPVDLAALRRAWQEILSRHEILRMVLVEETGVPEPRLPGDPVESFGSADVIAEPFDLATGPPARLSVVRSGPDEHRLELLLHRVVADEDSADILIRELSTLYSGSLAETPVPYAEFARWQREQDFTELLDWWSAALTPPAPPPVLPVERHTPAAPAGTLRFDWDPGTALADLCGAEHVPPVAVLLAAFHALLSRYGGEDRVAVGFPVTVRPAGFAGTVGPFDNLLVLPGDLSDTPTFRELARKTAQTLAEARTRASLPFTRLVAGLGGDRDPDGIPFCEAVFAFREGPEPTLELAGAEVARLDLEPAAIAADLVLTVDSVAPTVSGAVSFRGEQQEAAGVLLEQLRTLLAAGLAAPGTSVIELPLDDADRLNRTSQAADRLAAAVSAPPVHEIVRGHAMRRPTTAAVVWPGGALSYGDLERKAAEVTAHLRELGVAGSAVAIRMAPGPHQVAASLGVLRAGAHMIWFGTGDAGERGRIILAEQRPACLLREGPPDADPLALWYRDELGGHVIDVATVDGAAVDGRPAPALDPDGTAYVAYTSGSTGKPKGIAQTHGAFAQFVTWMAGALGIRPGSRVANWVTPEHDPSLCEVFATLVAGATLYPVPERIRVHPEKLVDWLARERITFLQTVPSFARELLAVITSTGAAERLDALDHLVLMGEALPGALAGGLRAALPGVRLVNLYGPTETIAATWCEITGDVHGTVPIGHSIPGRQVLVLDEAGRPCPTGVTGEIVIRSPYVTRGYIGDEQPNDAFHPVPGFDDGVACYRTGDLARRRWDGQLEFRGRRDHQVKLYGNRLELTEIEDSLAGHESVAECVVVPLTDADGLVIQLVAYVVPADGAELATGPLRAHLRRRFGASVQLVTFETVPGGLPRNLTGKVDRRRLPKPSVQLGNATRMPQTPVEQGVAEIWSELLGARRVGAEEAFFAIGGHSLLIPALVDRFRQRFGVEIPLRDCFTHNTVAGQSALLVSAGARDATAA